MTARQDHTDQSQRKLDIMIDQILPTSFNLRIWQFISSKSPQQFITNQQDILNILLSDNKLFDSFFFKFYTNHQHLNDWYLLANSNQIDIKKYVFNRLLAKKYKEYRQIIKNQQLQMRYSKSNEVFRQKEEIRKQKKKQSFHKMFLQNAKKRSIFKNPSKEKQQVNQFNEKYDFLEREVQKQDYHQLFLKTFSACDGSKYIYYDFNKHMRGISGKKKYNQFIRIKKHKKNNSNDIDFNFTTEFSTSSIRKTEQCVKSIHSSFYTKQNDEFLHEKQEDMTNLRYCNFQIDPIGEIKKMKYNRQVILLKKTIGGLKKVKTNAENSKFQLRKRKIL